MQRGAFSQFLPRSYAQVRFFQPSERAPELETFREDECACLD